MDSKIIPQSPHACCFICYSIDVDKVCHHCGKAICKEHSSEFIFWNYEFTRLLLWKKSVSTRKDVVHCHSCATELHHKWLFLRCLGGIISLDSAHGRYLKGDDCLLIPTLPSVSSITIEERIHGHVTLDVEGTYSEDITLSPQGSVAISTKFNAQDRERVKAYRRKYRIPEDENLLFHAGFVVMQQTANVCFDPSVEQDCLQTDTFILRSSVAKQSFLSQNSDKKLDDVWSPKFPYKISRADEKEIPLPIQLIPILIRDDAIALVVQSRPGVADLVQVKSAQIDELTVSASPHLSKVTFIDPPARIYNLDITWIKPEIETHQQTKATDQPVEEESEQKWQESQSHYMRFQNPIHLLDKRTQLSGKLTMTLEGTLSGIETPLLFFPWGHKLDDEEVAKKCKSKTKIEVSFDLDLSSLRCPKRYPEHGKTAPPTKEYLGAMLNHHMVTRLTQRLNEIGAYVKRVVENPARTDKANANITNHFWDIAGRYYEGLYAVNFHLVLTGKQDRGQSNACSVVAELYVHGLVTNEEMQTQIDEVQTELQQVVEEILKDYVHPSGGQHSSNGFSSKAEVFDRPKTTQLVEEISDLLNQLGNILRGDSSS